MSSLADSNVTTVNCIERSALMSNWDDLIDFINQQADEYVSDQKRSYGLRLATEEIISNIIRESEKHLQDQTILECKACLGELSGHHCLIIQISDNAPAFDPDLENASNQQEDLHLRDRTEGGLGIFLVKQSVDIAEYSYSEGRNVYRLVVYTDEGDQAKANL